MYLDMVAKYKSQHGFRLYAYCLLPDRLELLVEPGENASISEIMHDLNSLYTKYFNGRYEKRGHLFDARFRSVLVEKAAELLSMTRHIHWAPARAEGFSGGAIADYPYSSFLIYRHTPDAGDPASAKLDMSREVAEVLSFLKEKDDAGAYTKYVLDADKTELDELEKSLRRGSVYGSESFRQAVRKRVEEHTEELQKEPVAKTSRVVMIWIGGIVLLATAGSASLYVSKRQVEDKYQVLLREKEAKFVETTRFENQSPLAVTELEGTQWEIELVPSPRGGVIRKDRIFFRNGRFQSDILEAEGFRSSTYLLVPQGGKVVQWQSAQADPTGRTALWNATWQGEGMKGTLTMKSGQEEKTFMFFSVKWAFAS